MADHSLTGHLLASHSLTGQLLAGHSLTGHMLTNYYWLAICLIVDSPLWTQFALNKFTGYKDQSVNLLCDTHGYPTQTYSWKRNGQSVGSSTSHLTLDKVKDTDFGKYTCHVTNEKGTSVFDIHLLKPGKKLVLAFESCFIKMVIIVREFYNQNNWVNGHSMEIMSIT